MKPALFSAALLTTLLAYSQETDTVRSGNIEDVVITGQFTPQGVNKSVYKVEVINEEQIKNMAATQVAEVLNQSMNILITPDSRSGNSTANIMGLNGNYVKILIDNIPVVGDTGLGSNIDLTKISVANVERIEIVRGSMGVEYGNGALAGIINIITKKGSSSLISGRASVQEETVRDQYNLRKKGEGRHIQNLSLNARLAENWSAGVSVNHNQFMGYDGEKKGYKYFEPDNKRGYDWNPKDQYDANAVLQYNTPKTKIFYKLSFLQEKFNYYNPNVQKHSLNDGNGGGTYVAIDRDYRTRRWIHHLNAQAKLGRVNYQGDFSFQSQDRRFSDYVYDIPQRQRISAQTEQSYYKTNILYSRGAFSNFLNSTVFNFQLGYELDHTDGYAALIAGDFLNENVDHKVFTYANFLAAEWNISDRFSLKPGARLTVSNRFDHVFNAQLSARWRATPTGSLRFLLGTANVLPTYDQLFTYFVNTNHDIRGNLNLTPEKGFSASIFWDDRFTTAGDWTVNYGSSVVYLDNQDRIKLVLVKEPSGYRYENVDRYRSSLLSVHSDFAKNNFRFSIQAAVNGIAQEINEMDSQSPTDFLYNLQAGASALYRVPRWATSLALYYKYTGKEPQYTQDFTTGQYVLGKIDDFHMLDFMVSQPFLNDRFEIGAGIKNILDVTRVANTVASGSGHNISTGPLNLFYGRSYFARLLYQF